MRPFTRDGAGVVAADGVGAVDGVPCPLGPVPILGGAVDGIFAVDSTDAVAVSCKRALMHSTDANIK